MVDGKVSVVTGGASGIGEGMARRLVSDGGRCVIADVQLDRGQALAPSGRAALPQDVAATAVLLASDEAWHVNEACLVVDCGAEVLGEKASRYRTSEGAK